jgi:site-specific recombinase XerD
LKAGFDHVHDYPRRMELAVKRLEENKKVSLHNRFKIFRFMDYLETRGVSQPRRIRYLVELTGLASMLSIDFEKATRRDIEKVILEHGRLDVSENTKADFKVTAKRFYKWLRDPNDTEYPVEVKWIRTTLKDRHSFLPEELLTEDDVLTLVKKAECSRDRALVSMLYDSGGRVGEILSLQRKNVAFDEHGAVVVVEGKTGQRRERLISSVPFLSQWLSEHPDDRPDAPLWVESKQGTHKASMRPLDYYSARMVLRRLGAKAGIKKAVNPHAFRHARATHLANLLTEAQLKEMFGWTQDSKVAARYVHLSGRDVDTALLRAHGLQQKLEDENPKLTVVTCVRCGLQNSTVHKFCSRCSMPLDLKTALEMKEKLSKESDEEMQKMRDELDELRFAVRLLQDASGYRVEPVKQSTSSSAHARDSRIA